uniref:hypothetical protein n=1 Tax=Caballeronia sp. LjRoot34 TaxID=3342325 RepID=UPI003F507BB4
MLHIPAVVVHGNALSLDVWGMWYTPAHVMGGWKWKLRRREAESQAQALLDTPVAEPTRSDPHPASDVDYPYSDGDLVIEDPVVVDDIACIETVAHEETPTVKLFTKIDQLALF